MTKSVNIKIFNKEGDIIFDKSYDKSSHHFNTLLVSKIANIVYGGYGNEKSDVIVISNSRSKNKKTTMQYVLEFLGFK